MRLDVFKGAPLVATFADGCEPAYFGEAGQRVRALLDNPRYGHRLPAREGARGAVDAGAQRMILSMLDSVLMAEGCSVVNMDTPGC